MYVSDVNYPTAGALNNIMRKVNALGHRPTIIVELDKLVHVPGLKHKQEVVDYVKQRVVKTFSMVDPTELVVDVTEETVTTTVGDAPAMPITGVSSPDQLVVTAHYGSVDSAHTKPHGGLDLGYPCGTNVSAVFGGKVIHAGWNNGGFGNLVVIDHGNGTHSYYAHLSQVDCHVSQTVNKGSVIGKVGTTGDSTGCHLHLEFRTGASGVFSGTRINPMAVLRGTNKVVTDIRSETSTTVNTREVRSEEATTYYRDFDIPITSADGDKFSNMVGVETFKQTHPDGRVVELLGFKSVGVGQVKTFTFEHEWNRPGYVDWDYYANLGNDKDVVQIYLDDVLIVTIKGNSGAGEKGWVKVPPLKLTVGKHKVKVNFYNETGSSSVFGFTHIKCAEFTNASNINSSTISYEYDQITEVTKEEWYDIGGFAYDETFFLDDDIVSWEIDTHWDKASATATITLDNKHGFYSPDYYRDGVDHLRKSPYVWYERGQQRHILSEGTPVRIYVGFEGNMVRRFTGFIKGEIEEDSENRTLTFHCVDRYDILEQTVLYKPLQFPPEDQIAADGTFYAWLKSSIVQYLAVFGGMTNWRVIHDDLMYPDLLIQDTYYMDVRAKDEVVMKFDEDGKIIPVPMKSLKYGAYYKNPFVEMIGFEIGEKVSECIQKVIGEINFRAYCNRYGTFVLSEVNYWNNAKWEFTAGRNLMELHSSTDYSRVRNHLMVAGSNGDYDHFFDRDLVAATRGQIRTAGVQLDWIDDFGGDARQAKKIVADRAFFDMKRQARTKNLVVKGNPFIEVGDGCYVHDPVTSTTGYYFIKGDRLVGNENGMVNFLEVTWREEGY